MEKVLKGACCIEYNKFVILWLQYFKWLLSDDLIVPTCISQCFTVQGSNILCIRTANKYFVVESY